LPFHRIPAALDKQLPEVELMAAQALTDDGKNLIFATGPANHCGNRRAAEKIQQGELDFCRSRGERRQPLAQPREG
jgi:hypothetical protein